MHRLRPTATVILAAAAIFAALFGHARSQVQQPPIVVMPPAIVGHADTVNLQFTATTNRKWIPKARHFGHFFVRTNRMRGRVAMIARGTWPQPVLPVGWVTPINSVIPIDDNDTYGICGPAMGAHVDSIMTLLATGTASRFDASQLLNQYLSVSGGDNGTNEPEMVGPIWGGPSGIAGATPPGAILQDHLDIGADPRSIAGAVAHQGFVCVAVSLPDAWIDAFDPSGGAVWDGGVTGNPNNGHYVPIVGVKLNGNYIVCTWGSWVELTPAGLSSNHVDPELFTGWTNRMFNPTTGLAFDGQTFAAKAAVYAAAGGTPPANPFPTPSPTPTPVPVPTPTPVPAPTPTPPVSSSVIMVDVAGLTIHLPDGFTFRLVPGPINGTPITIHPRIKAVDGPRGYKVD